MPPLKRHRQGAPARHAHLVGLPAAAASPTVEANQALMLTVLRTQDEIEATQRASNERETAADLRLQAQRLSEENRQLVETARLKN